MPARRPRHRRPLAALSTALLIALGRPARAASAAHDPRDDTDFHLGAELDARSRFYFRGLPESRTAVLQPSFAASGLGFHAGFFTNILADEGIDRARFSALMPTLAYHLSLGPLTFTPALSYYDDLGPRSVRTTLEPSLGASITWGRAHLATAHAFDVLSHPGAYYGTLAVGYERELDDATLQAAAQLAFVNADGARAIYGVERGGPALVQADVSSTSELTDEIYLDVHAEAGALLLPVARARAPDTGFLAGGVALGFEL
jgi:hypothetical protein